jgi:dipeptidase
MTFDLDYVRGDAKAEPLPMWIKPERKLTLQDVVAFIARHFEDSELICTSASAPGRIIALPLAAADMESRQHPYMPRAFHLHPANRFSFVS